ncbi:hypothetical protein DYB37_009673 [Aphanomyces astaci]|uniref:Uncharacterized protein n=1 Tax=Aphanomyces astaci TaxID=112090 RepID=A0A3R7AYX0_APHAT|nr:hypothetical protein DYB35_006781 [Aphanomyces astaci]RHZ22188.1 hypothetical protein DYB37_009673 [Aphanomyces astaci]
MSSDSTHILSICEFTVPAATTVILLSLDLWRIVAAFQTGVYLDMQPLAKLAALPKHYRSNEGKIRDWIQTLGAALSPWYATYGTSRIGLLVLTLPRMRDLMITHAVYFNDVGRLAFLHATFDVRRCRRNLLNLAAARGHDASVAYLHSIGHQGCNTGAMNLAAQFGHLRIVQFLHAHRTEGCSIRAMDAAAREGHLDVVQWLHFNRTEGCTIDAMDESSVRGHLEVVQWLHKNRLKGCSFRAMDAAAGNGHLETVTWLLENRTEGCTPQLSLAEALRFRHLDVAVFAR